MLLTLLCECCEAVAAEHGSSVSREAAYEHLNMHCFSSWKSSQSGLNQDLVDSLLTASSYIGVRCKYPEHPADAHSGCCCIILTVTAT